MQAVYADWADELGGMSLAAIDHGIRESKGLHHPPSQGEFKALCKSFKPTFHSMIGKNISPEQREKNKLRIADIASMLAKKQAAQ